MVGIPEWPGGESIPLVTLRGSRSSMMHPFPLDLWIHHLNIDASISGVSDSQEWPKTKLDPALLIMANVLIDGPPVFGPRHASFGCVLAPLVILVFPMMNLMETVKEMLHSVTSSWTERRRGRPMWERDRRQDFDHSMDEIRLLGR